jgi:hypothetical protein
MACESLAQSLAGLEQQEKDQQDLIKLLNGHPLEVAKARLTEIQGEIAKTSDDLAACRAANLPVTASASTVGYVGTVEVETDATPRLWFSLTASAGTADWVKIGSVRAWFTMDLSSTERPYYLAMLPLLLEAMRNGDQVSASHGGVAGFQKQAPNDSFEAIGVRVLRAPIRF